MERASAVLHRIVNALGPIPKIVTLNTRPTTKIKDNITAKCKHMFCYFPHNCFNNRMVLVVIFLPGGMTKKLQMPYIRCEIKSVYFFRQFLGISGFAPASL